VEHSLLMAKNLPFITIIDITEELTEAMQIASLSNNTDLLLTKFTKNMFYEYSYGYNLLQVESDSFA
jgi:hypothetical protein